MNETGSEGWGLAMSEVVLLRRGSVGERWFWDWGLKEICVVFGKEASAALWISGMHNGSWWCAENSES